MESNSQSENPENDVKKKTQNATRKRRTKTEKENAGKGKKNGATKKIRVQGIEPWASAWKALMLPLHHTRRRDLDENR